MTADDTVTAKLAEWEALANAATEGPWREDDASASVVTGWAFEGEDEPQVICDWLEPGDAAFVAAARHMVPALLAFVKDVRQGHEVSPVSINGGEACAECWQYWPCPTEQAARKWIGGEG